MTLSINDTQHNRTLNVISAKYRILFIVMLSVVILSVVMLSIVMMSVVMLSVVMLNVVMLSCKAFCEFRTVYENDYLRVPYNNQK